MISNIYLINFYDQIQQVHTVCLIVLCTIVHMYTVEYIVIYLFMDKEVHDLLQGSGAWIFQ